MFFFSALIPCEVNADISLPTVDLGEGERGDVTPDFQGFPKDASNLFLAHLPGKPHNPVGDQRRCQTHLHAGYIAGRDHRHCVPPSHLISAVVSSARRCAVRDGLRLSMYHCITVSSLFLFDLTTQCEEWKIRRETSLPYQRDTQHLTNDLVLDNGIVHLK